MDRKEKNAEGRIVLAKLVQDVRLESIRENVKTYNYCVIDCQYQSLRAIADTIDGNLQAISDFGIIDDDEYGYCVDYLFDRLDKKAIIYLDDLLEEEV